MIIGLQHPGSGCGDQLFCYLAARTTAERLGVPFGTVGKFKGESFIKRDEGIDVPLSYTVEEPAGKIVVQGNLPVFETTRNYYDPEFNFIEDNTIVDGCTLQDERYFDLSKVREWLQTEPLEMPEDVCVINFRGGEFAGIRDLFLPISYWYEAIEKMLNENSKMKFEVHTDDPYNASQFFPEYKIIHDVSINWRAVRYAKYAIIANSAFGIIPRLLRQTFGPELPSEDWDKGYPITIAPRRWARRNVDSEWQLPQNYYKKFTYI